MAFYGTGDTHGGIDIGKITKLRLKNESGIDLDDLTRDDYIIVAGDWGLPFLRKDVNDENSIYFSWIKELAEYPCTILWVDGNHENFDFWKEVPITNWKGGRVRIHPHAANVIQLLRGEIYNINGKTVFAFGGARSIDKARRVEHISWWKDEDATFEEEERALANLEKVNYKVDYIITHTPPQKLLTLSMSMPLWRSNELMVDPTAQFLDEILDKVSYKLWLCGHVHNDTDIFSFNMAVRYHEVSDLEYLELLYSKKLGKSKDL